MTELERLRGEVVVLREIANEVRDSLLFDVEHGDSRAYHLYQQRLEELDAKLNDCELSALVAAVVEKAEEFHRKRSLHFSWSPVEWQKVTTQEYEESIKAIYTAVDALRKARGGGEADSNDSD